MSYLRRKKRQDHNRCNNNCVLRKQLVERSRMHVKFRYSRISKRRARTVLHYLWHDNKLLRKREKKLTEHSRRSTEVLQTD